MIFASSKPRTKKVWHEICCGCHFGSRRAVSAILAVKAAKLTEPLSWVGHPSQANGLISSPIVRVASYCDRKASTLSRLPGLPTFTIIVSSPKPMRGSTRSPLALTLSRMAERLNFSTFSLRIVPPSAVRLSQGIANPTKHR